MSPPTGARSTRSWRSPCRPNPPRGSSRIYLIEWRKTVAPDHTWRKAARSENTANCVELRGTLDQLRDSKNPSGSVLHANAPALVRSIQAGHLHGTPNA
ncbi:DUF397 domain-containing protein [Herbihabitans rhizosphaerae]|uniref:DUF397 domain-containing protein n=1 Tax=Herbihabitans rhizosphaerae TaxID=1872711 RepID=UPI00102CEDAB|nr:DUF397 domain-containing protein [Herbihabitans rhizosphaerae]